MNPLLKSLEISGMGNEGYKKPGIIVFAKFIILLFILFLLPSCSLNVQAESDLFIRVNQLGFLPNDVKSAVILSNRNLVNEKILLVDVKNNKSVKEIIVNNNIGVYGNFKFSYHVDFSDFKKPGVYELQTSGKRSNTFSINNSVYNNVAEELLSFFQVQRCGYTNPYLHEICHVADATSLIENGNIIEEKYDVTGGWHDAGDYVKFLNTTAYATYMLLFSYDFDKSKFSFDKNKNNVPDVLDEAKIGLDWLLRADYKGQKLITQVQDLTDHEVGWRMPEDDPLSFKRPAFLGIGKNLIGIYSATLALASRIWRQNLSYPEFADRCIQTAEKYYSIRNSVPDIDSSGTGMYVDNNFSGKLSLAAVELFISTGKNNYLKDSKNYADNAGSDFWWSWGNINSLAHYRLGSFDIKYADYIKNNLEEFNRRKNENLFGKGTSIGWGTNNTLLGITLQNILWKRLTNNSDYDSVAAYQRDFVLGRNPWGVSFITGIGHEYVKNLHHQIGKIKVQLPGGFAAGPASKQFLKNYKIEYGEKDKYDRFQTDEVYYRDDWMDYVTNEPTITANATAIFIFGCLSKN